MQWGEPATVFDTALMRSSADRLEDYLFNRGYFLADVQPRFTEYKQRVTVIYQLTPGPLYRYDSILYQIPDSLVRSHVERNRGNSLLKKGAAYSQENLSKERERIDLLLKDNGYYDFVNTSSLISTPPTRHPTSSRLA
jgi:outer membrane protein insertion porin family